MKICKKCGDNFPNTMIIDGKKRYLHVRSYCLNCSPFNEKRGYLLRKQDNDAKHAIKEGGSVRNCPICFRDFVVKGRKGNNVCSNCRCWYRRYLNKKAIYSKMGNKCCECGCDNLKILTMHHINPKNKSFDFAEKWHLGIDTLAKEAKKCILLCPNCHACKHYTYRKDIIDYYSDN